MKRGHPLQHGFAAASVILAVAATQGCGGISCSETATCAAAPNPAPDASFDGAATGVANDASLDSDAQAVDDTGAVAALDSTPPPVFDGCTYLGPENCTNGIDDDCNGQTDCSDPACAPAFKCTASPPSGWFGPGTVFEAVSGTTPPGCSGAFPNDSFDLHASPTSPPGGCTCACGNPTGACSAPTIEVFTDNQCNNACGTSGGESACSRACSTWGQSAGVKMLPQPVSGGSCKPQAISTFPPYSWGQVAQGCTASRVFLPGATGGCGEGSVCANRPPSSAAGYMPTLCVWKAGSVGCAAAGPGYPLPLTLYSNAIDGRTCSDNLCVCGNPTNVACTLVKATAHPDATCSKSGTDLSDLNLYTPSDSGPLHCNAIGMMPAGSVVDITSSVSSTGSCLPGGTAQMSGVVSADPSTAWTICCSQ